MANVVVVGTSAGGLAALRQLVAGLAVPFPGTLFIVQHQGQFGRSYLQDLLQQRTELRVKQPANGETIQDGCVYVAPRDKHLILSASQISLRFGPRVSGMRPSIDMLFCSAANAFGPAAIGVLLSGYLDDGVTGLAAIKDAGGTVVVQDPADAEVDSMPRSALKYMTPDYQLPAAEIGQVLSKLARRTTVDPGGATMDEKAVLPQAVPDQPEPVTVFSCPDCGGAMQLVESSVLKSYKCHVGHSRTAESLLAEQAVVVERSMWYVTRTLKEMVALASELESQARLSGDNQAARQFAAQKVLAKKQLSSLNDDLLRAFEGEAETA
jgi:two-component system, chemotaxis family, protein-glutamate methylesterase/glutaminase